MEARKHPIALIEQVRKNAPAKEMFFFFSRYHIAPPGEQAASRRTPPLRVSSNDVVPDWFKLRLGELDRTEELAWHSLVELQGSLFHIPMIDFQFAADELAIDEIAPDLEGNLGHKFVFFRTGRSFHAYSPDLISEPEWTSYLGRLLLLNKNASARITDNRWVGHSLVRGFSALRWSHNTDRYLQLPELVA